MLLSASASVAAMSGEAVAADSTKMGHIKNPVLLTPCSAVASTQYGKVLIFDNRIHMADDPQGDVRRILQK